ncbi:uncharacterized protein AUP68_15198 [Ilyonectria robusta]
MPSTPSTHTTLSIHTVIMHPYYQSPPPAVEAGLMLGISSPSPTFVSTHGCEARSRPLRSVERSKISNDSDTDFNANMPTFKSPVDGTSLYYRYYEPLLSASDPAQPLTLVLLHGWPMSSRMWDHFFMPLVQVHGFRVLAPDRRGFGNSDWNAGPVSPTPASGSAHDPSTPRSTAVSWETLTGDLSALLAGLDIGPFAFVAASMGCPESVLTYLSSAYVRANCRAFVWIGPNMPYNIRCDACPAAPLPEVWDFLSAGLGGAGGQGLRCRTAGQRLPVGPGRQRVPGEGAMVLREAGVSSGPCRFGADAGHLLGRFGHQAEAIRGVDRSRENTHHGASWPRGYGNVAGIKRAGD